MAKTPTSWDMKAVNTWWQRGLDKERARFSNRPPTPKGNKFMVPTNLSVMAPPLTSFTNKKKAAHGHSR